MIYDCFSFFNELETLEIRLNTLKDVVDRFVLVESSWTHRGLTKEFIFEKNKDRFRPFLDRIIHIKLTNDNLPEIPSDGTEIHQSWIRENTQRNAIVHGLSDAKPDDILIISDLDEIPSPASVKHAIQTPNGITNVAIRNYSFWLNNANVSAPYHYRGPRILTAKTFFDKKTYANAEYPSFAPREANPIPSATLIRFAKATRTHRGGWHFSSQGDIERIKTKINSIADGVFVDKKFQSTEAIAKQISQGNAMTPGVRDVLIPEPLTHDFPPFLVTHQDQFASQLLPASEESWQRSRMTRYTARIRYVVYGKLIALIISLVPKPLHPICAKIRKQFHL